MKESIHKGFALAALFALAASCMREPPVSNDKSTTHPENEPPSNDIASALHVPFTSAISVLPDSRIPRAQAPLTIKNPFPEIPRSRENLDLESDPFGPTSQAEQRWLDAHGFPNARQWETYTLASDYLLEQAANSGDGVARTMLDARHLSEDPEAKTRLFVAGSEGNIFALSSLATYMTGSKNGNLQVGYSLSRVAEMRGDSRIAMARDIGMPRKLDDIEKIQAEADAIRMNNQLDQMYREKHGVAPPPPVRRPVIELEN